MAQFALIAARISLTKTASKQTQDNELIETTGKWKNWDIPSSFNLVDLAAAVKAAEEKARAARPVGLVLVDGIVLFSHPDLVQQFNAIIALDIPEAHFKERRFNRDTWIQENGEYFEDVVLPAHYEHGIIPSLDHGRTFRVDALQSMDQVHQSVFEQLEAWRGSKS